MEEFVEEITRGNVSGVKIVLATVVLALAVYQVLLMAVGYGKLELPFLKPKAASFAHRSIGDAIVLIALVVAFMCIAYFGYEDGVEHAAGEETGRATLHVIGGTLVVGVLALKVVAVRWWHALGPRLDRREELRELEDVREERQEQREERQELREERNEG